MGKIKKGCTLFCFGTPYIQGKFTLDDAVRIAAEIGCEGYELVATQMLRTYPYVTDEVVGEFQRYADKYGIAPVCYAANMDCGLRRDRDLTPDEMFAIALRDIKNANRLGCKVMRAQYLTTPEVMVRLAPYAEEYDVKIGIEIHNPETPNTPSIVAYLEAFDRCGSEYLGFIPDLGYLATKPNKPHWDRALANGVSQQHLDMLQDMRYNSVSQQEATKTLMEAGAAPAIMGAISGAYGFVQFRKNADLDSLRSILPHSFEIHGKCHYISEDLVEASIPYDEILPLIRDSGFDGYIMAEYEDEGGYDSIAMTKRFIAMVEKAI